MWGRTLRLIVILTLAMLATPLAAAAQQADKVYRIGCMPGGLLAPRMHQWDAFRQTLGALGWVEGHNITLEFRAPAREGGPFDALAADLVRLPVDVIVATGIGAVRAAMRATRTIPIVMSPIPDPVGLGFVASLARPGGNVTGTSVMEVDLRGKRLEILKQIVPDASRVAVLWVPGDTAPIDAVRAAARVLGVELVELQVPQAGDQAHNLASAFETATRERAEAMIVIPSTLFFGLRERIAALAVQHRLPAIYSLPAFAHAGGLVVYGPSDTEYYRRAAVYVDKLLKGATPGDLPVEQPHKLELLINLKAAKALGLTIPPMLLFQATEVLQ